MKNVLQISSVCCLILLIASCGDRKFKTGDDWDPNEVPFFDDGVDIVDDFSSLSGKFAYETEKAFDGRVQLADLVAVVDIKSVQTAMDVDGDTGKRIDVEIAQKIYGVPPSNVIQLISATDAMGHQFLLRHESRLSGQFIVFIRWFKDEKDAIGHHFHLSPASEFMLAETKKRSEARKKEESAKL